MSDDEIQRWFESIWADREDRVYPAFFGDTGKTISNIPVATFRSLGQPEPDPRFLTHGVLECPPTERRRDWVYVTSGMSNPWGETPETVNPKNYSGLGFEFVMHAREGRGGEGQARWAMPVLHYLMAAQILVACGQLQGHLLEKNDRVPLGGPLWKKDGVITHLLIAGPPGPPDGYPGTFELASGKVDLMLVLGITERESEFAKTQGAESLVELLQHHGVFPVTDPSRVSVL